jgi:hypothetical protein
MEVKHLKPAFDSASPVIELNIVRVDNAVVGGTPEIVFTASADGSPIDLLANPMGGIAVTMSAAAPEFGAAIHHVIQGNSPVGSLTADTEGFKYTFPAALPGDAEGTYRFGLEGYVMVTTARVSALNPFVDVAVTGDLAPRRAVVDQAKCNLCHGKLAMHEATATNVAYCAMCHNPQAINSSMPAPAAGQTATVPTLDLKVMVHSLHMGENLESGFVLYEADGTAVDFSEIAFPRSPSECTACHLDGTYNLPLSVAVAPTKTVEIDSAAQEVSATLLPATTAVCTSCHDASAVVAHTQLETTASGIEACATCHGASRDFSVAASHNLE